MDSAPHIDAKPAPLAPADPLSTSPEKPKWLIEEGTKTIIELRDPIEDVSALSQFCENMNMPSLNIVLLGYFQESPLVFTSVFNGLANNKSAREIGLEAGYCELGSQGTALLTNLTNLTKLNIPGNTMIINPLATSLGVYDEDYKEPGPVCLPTMLTRLRSLDLQANQLNDDNIAALSVLTSLVKLKLAGSAVEPRGMAGLAHLTNLQHLDLERTRLKSAYIEQHLSILTNLTSIRAGGNGFGIDDMAHLKHFTKLKTLNGHPLAAFR
jgi:hypothetical protein